MYQPKLSNSSDQFGLFPYIFVIVNMYVCPDILKFLYTHLAF